jgi:DNA polymerase family A
MFGEFLKANKLLDGWPRTPTGRLATSEDALRAMAEGHSIVRELIGHLTLLDQLMTFQHHIGPDGRSRIHLAPFGTKTGRNAPSGKGNLLAKSAAFRPLIQPPPGRALSSLDWGAQELRIAAAKSKDPELRRVASLPDPYIGLASSVGLAQPTDTKTTNPKGRKVGKVMQLAMLFGIGARTFRVEGGHVAVDSQRLPPEAARDVLRVLLSVRCGGCPCDAGPPAQNASRLDLALSCWRNRKGTGQDGEEFFDSSDGRRHDAARDDPSD